MRTSLLALSALALSLPGSLLAQRGAGGRGAVSDSVVRLAATPADPAEKRFEAARIAWEDGHFPTALRTFDSLLVGSSASRFLGRIAQITGTPYEMTELTPDGNPQLVWSTSGRLFAFEAAVISRVGNTVVARKSATGFDNVQTFNGRIEAFAGNDALAVIHLTKPTTQIERLRDTIGLLVAATRGSATTPQQQVITQAYNRLAPLVAAATTVSTLNLSTGATQPLDLGGRRFVEARFFPDNRSLAVIAAVDSGDAALWKTDLTGSTWQRMTNAPVAPSRIVTISPDGATIVVAAGGAGGGGRAGAGGGGRGGAGGGGRGAAGGGAPAPSLYVVRADGVTPIMGANPSVSRNGDAFAVLVRNADSARIEIRERARPDSAIVVWRGRSDLNPANPAISPDGKRVAFEMTPREDKEIYVASAGAPPVKVTYHIPHDILPMWLTNDYLVAQQGEGRHRQTFGYDLRTLLRDRLFHNNTIRTIAPEYGVVLAPDGKGMLVNAEGDGNTISPERGSYLLDFDRPMTAASVRARIKTQLADELALRAKANEIFATNKAAITALTNQVSVSRLHDHLDTLTRWGSRHITQPGNRKALDYLARTLQSYGYEVEMQEFMPGGNSSANVVATLKGTVTPDAVYVVSAHMDSQAAAPGADDDGSGTVINLELARILKDHPQAATIQFAFFTGEESGLLGAREFVRRFTAAKTHVVGAINNDMVGFADDHRLNNTIRYSNAGLRDVQYGASLLFSRLTLYSAKYYKSTDAQAYTDAIGEVVTGIGSYPVLNSPHYHQSSDVMEIINFQQLGETAKTTVASIVSMASSPSQLKGLAVTPSGTGWKLSWTKAIEKDVVRYEVRYTNKAGAIVTTTSATPSAVLPAVKGGTEIMVRAVNRAGRSGWDWARLLIGGE